MSLFAELKRRRVFRALIGWGIAAFAILQIIEPIMHGLRWPDAVLGYVVVALAFGFPVVITLAWIFDVQPDRAAPVARGRVALALAAIGILAAAPGLAWYFLRRPAAPIDRSIAVLPFASLSAEKDASYFADGFQDELLRQLAQLGDLQVISHTSVAQYREATRNLKEIGEALGVASIVEGSVQRSGNRVRVEARLVDARTDRQLWSERYDRDLTDVFAIQSALAEEIAAALRAQLSPEQKRQLRKRPTPNLEAYDLYLQAREYEQRTDMLPREREATEALYRKAIAADPAFALARARLSSVLSLRAWLVAGTPASVRDDAKREADEALRLDPELPLGHYALGIWHYYSKRDYDAALREFAVARAGAPFDALPAIAYVERRQGRFDEAARHLEEAVRLDPRSTSLLMELGATYQMTRRYPEAQRAFERAAAIPPDADAPLLELAALQEMWRGDRGPAKAVLRKVIPRLQPESGLTALSSALILMWHNPEEALAILEAVPARRFFGSLAIFPRELLAASAHEALGEAALARAEYAAAVPWLEAQVRDHPEAAGEHFVLALAYAGLQRKPEALREARQAVEALPLSKDAVLGQFPLGNLALVEARVGEKDAAIDHIRQLLAVPSYLSPGVLRVDPRWAPLYDDPRFRELAEIKIPVRASR